MLQSRLREKSLKRDTFLDRVLTGGGGAYIISIQNFCRLRFFHINIFLSINLKTNKQKLSKNHLSHLHPQQQKKGDLIIFHFTVTGTFY